MTKTDSALRKTTIAAIKRHSVKPYDWSFTKFYETELPQELGSIKGELDLQEKELPVASTIWKATDWTFVTTKKVVGKIDNKKVSVDIIEVEQWSWGDFKGYKDKHLTKMTLT